MPTSDETTLSEALRTGGKQARDTAYVAIQGLAAAAGRLDMRETAGKLQEAAGQLKDDSFKIIVMGRFKNGKSTMLNALLGGTTRPVRLDGHKGPMVVDDLPATATLTSVSYAEEPYVRALGFDGNTESWSFAKYLQESTLGIDEVESQRRFQAVKEFEMGYPATLCKEGVLVFDSPGLDEHTTRTLITREATKRCDAAIMVYRSDVLMGQTELIDANSVVADGTQLFTVINLWGRRQPDDRLRGYVWNKYVRDQLGGPGPAVIEEEERGIAQTVELNQREQEDRERALAALAETSAAASEQREALQRALVIARQTG